MFTTNSPCTTFITPQDADVPDQLTKLIDSATSSLRFIIYGCTLQPFFDAIARAYARGVDVQGIFDHSQACGPKESARLHALFLAVPPAKFRIGTSEDAHQIVHLKGLWIDNAAVWTGSWNFSDSATQQVNHVDIFTACPNRAQHFQQAFDTLWAFIDQNEQAYQQAA